MSEEKPKGIEYGKPVVFNPPPPPPSKRGASAPGFLILTLLAILAAIVLSPDSPESSPTASPLPTLAPIKTPRSTLETIVVTPVNRGNDSEAFGCEPGIGVDKSVTVIFDAVRMRRTIGFVNKDDATDTVHLVKRGDTVKVKGGPASKDGLCWWLVEHQGYEGWSADKSQTGTVLLSANP